MTPEIPPSSHQDTVETRIPLPPPNVGLDPIKSVEAAIGSRWLRWTLVILIVACGGGAAAWWFWKPKALEPPMPANIVDTDVLFVIERARQRVLESPMSGNAWGRYGMMLLAQLFDREADYCFIQANRLDPTDPTWPYARGQIALKRDPENALAYLREAVRIGSAMPATRSAMRLQLAEALQERQQFDEAEAIFREELARKPGDPRCSLGLAMIIMARGGDETKATELFEVARKSPNSRKTATAQLAALARARGDQAEANNYQQEVAKLGEDEGFPDPVFDELASLQAGRRGRDRRIFMLEKDHRFREAAQLYLDHIEKEPTAAAYTGAGVNLARTGQYDKAVALLHEAVRLDPGNPLAQYTLALVQFTRAEKSIKQASDGPQEKAWLREAIEHARRATEEKPDYARAYLFWGLAHRYLGELEAAVPPLRRGVATLPTELELQYGLGEVLLELGQLKEAETYLENARQLDLTDPRPGAALEKLRKKLAK